MRPMPRDENLDSTLAFLAEPYEFISKRCHRYGRDLFETRLLLRRPCACPRAATLLQPAPLHAQGAHRAACAKRFLVKAAFRACMAMRMRSESACSCRL